jgi:hypothetical protein
VLNAVGRVAGTTAAPEIRVSDPAGIIRVDDVGATAIPEPSAGSPAVVEPPPSATRADGLGAVLGPNGAVGLGTLLVLSLASAAVTIARRRRGRRALARRVSSRLAAIVSPRPVGGGRDGVGP